MSGVNFVTVDVFILRSTPRRAFHGNSEAVFVVGLYSSSTQPVHRIRNAYTTTEKAYRKEDFRKNPLHPSLRMRNDRCHPKCRRNDRKRRHTSYRAAADMLSFAEVVVGYVE